MSIPEECTSYVKSVQSELQKTQDDLQLAESHLKTAQKKFTHENDKLQIQIQTLKKKILRLEQARGAEGFRQQQKMNSLSYKHSDVIDAFVKLTSEYENYLQYFEERLATYNRILDLLKNQKQKITRDNIMYHIFNTAPEDPGPTLERYKKRDEKRRERDRGKIDDIREEITQRSKTDPFMTRERRQSNLAELPVEADESQDKGLVKELVRKFQKPNNEEETFGFVNEHGHALGGGSRKGRRRKTSKKFRKRGNNKSKKVNKGSGSKKSNKKNNVN